MAPNTLQDIINKVRRITGRPSSAQITDNEIINYINTFYIYDFPEHLRLESLKVNYQFVTTANKATYDFPTNLYLTNTPPLYIGGYQSFFTQSRDQFFKINPMLNYLEQSVATGDGGSVYTFTLSKIPIAPGFKQNPNRLSAANTDSFGRVSGGTAGSYNWNVLISGEGSAGPGGASIWYSLIDDGQGNLVDPGDTALNPAILGSINYITGVCVLDPGFTGAIPVNNPINAQYIPYVASRPQSALFYQDQLTLYPIPDQAYTVSLEAYQYPIEFDVNGSTSVNPQLNEWWQVLAYGAADKIFADNADMENMAKFRPLLDEQLRLIQRRSITQQTSERTASIYTEQTSFGQYLFGNNF